VPELTLQLSEDEARALYRRLHRSTEDQDRFCDLYRQLQLHFFQTLTVDELTHLLEDEP